MTRARAIAWLIGLVAALASLAIAGANGCTSPPAPVLAESASPPPLPAVDVPDSIAALQSAIAQVLREEEVPGAAIALVDRDGIVWAGGVGLADVHSGTPVTGDTVFRVASITKSIVGLGVARLSAQGRLDVDAPLSRVLPELSIEDRFADAPVTLAHALEHTAGFDDMRFNEWFHADDAVTPAAALELNPRSRALRWRPGSRMSYSNVGYTIAGLAIERATGEPFDAWLHREILVPLGMERAHFRRTRDLSARLATGYREPGLAAPFRPIAHRPAGALLASARDLGHLVHWWLRRGEGMPPIVVPDALDRIERSGTLQAPRTDADYGLGNYGDVGHPALARGHDGGLPGFVSCYRYVPSLGVGYVMLLNASHSARAYARIRALIFAHLARGRVLPQPPRAREDAEPWAAFYAFANPRHALFGFLEQTLLGWRATPTAHGMRLRGLLGGPIDLVPTGDAGFRHPLQSGTSVRFGHDRDGRRVMSVGFVYAEQSSAALATIRLWALVLAKLLLDLAPIWAVGWIVVRLARRRDLSHAGVHVWPATCSMCLFAIQLALSGAARRDALGDVHPLTIVLCLATIAFALCSALALATSLRASIAADRPHAIVRIVPTLTAAVAFAMTLWLGAHGIIGLRTWSW